MAKDDSLGSGAVMLAFLAGAVVGAAVALLYAPATGEETGAARSPLHVPEIEAALGLALDTGVTSSRVTRLSERGALVWKRWEQTPWRRADRSVGGAILFIEDITDAMRQTLRLRTQTQQVQRLDEEMRTLANALADDLSGPLAQLEEVARGAAADEAIAITDARRDRLRRTRASVDKLKSMLTALRRDRKSTRLNSSHT